MKKYLVTKTYTQEVEAIDKAQAETIAEKQHMEFPEYDTEVEEVGNEPEELFIKIERASDEGYMYYIYLSKADADNDDDKSEDGGQCTTTLQNAIGMACDQAKAVVKRLSFCASGHTQDEDGRCDCTNADGK